MRMLALVLALCGLLPLQEESRVRDLLAKLDDDSIEVRAGAATALIDQGPAALSALRVAQANARGELKDRLAEIIRKIQDRDRLALLLPPPSRITIDAKDRPLREVFEKVSKQTRTPIDYSQVPDDATVTIALDRVPLWKAIDRICRASGKVMADVQTDHVIITAEPYVALPGKITDQFCVTLQKVELSTEVTFGGQQERYEHFNALFHVSWEKGARPYHITARITEMVDEQGGELVAQGEDEEPLMLSMISADLITQEFTLDTPRGPGPQATKISRLKVEVEFDFPLKYAEVKVDVSGGKFPAAAECPEFSVRLNRFDRQEGVAMASLVMTPRGPLEGEIHSEAVFLRDKKGNEYAAMVTEGSQTNENETPYQLSFPGAPENGEFTEILIRIPTEVHRERLEVELKDLLLK